MSDTSKKLERGPMEERAAWRSIEQRKRELVLYQLMANIEEVGQMRDNATVRGAHALAAEFQLTLTAFESAAELLAGEGSGRWQLLADLEGGK